MANNVAQNIIWLASYPKSGNTWFRAFLTALLSNNPQKEININELTTQGIFSGKEIVESVLDLSSDFLTQQQIDTYQQIAWNYYAEQQNTVLHVKIHDAFTLNECQEPLIPQKQVKGALYFVRNPLDVALSLANHVNCSIQEAIDEYIVNPNGFFVRRKPTANNQFHQPLGTWNMHVESWLNLPDFPVHFMRYEDMKLKPEETFKSAVDFLGLQPTDNTLQDAIESCAFDKLKAQESEQGFREKSPKSVRFFNKGEIGRWRKELTEEQIMLIKKHNEPMMRKFDYWEETI